MKPKGAGGKDSRRRQSRREFMTGSLMAAAASSGSGSRAAGWSARSQERVPGANERIQIGIIGLGSISRSHIRQLQALSRQAEIRAVRDIYRPRLEWGRSETGARGYHDYQDLLADTAIDAVLICTPDHWHARMSIDAMRAGKDVDVEKPMSRTIEEAREMARVSRATGRILPVDSEHISHGIWEPARIAVQNGVLGKLLWSQTSRSRNTGQPPWDYALEEATPENLDWERFLGPAPKRPFDPQRFFRWRRYWDYSGGIATDLYYHHVAPLLKVLGPEFPVRAASGGGNWRYPPEILEVPDTFLMVLDFPSRHSLLVGGSLANSTEVPIVVRGHEANLLFHGPDQRRPRWLTLEPEDPFIEGFREKVRSAGLEGEWDEKMHRSTENRSRKPVFRLEAAPGEISGELSPLRGESGNSTAGRGVGVPDPGGRQPGR